MKIELMSPSGNIAGFIEAVTNGADSVYLGLKKFNARRPADNFSFHDFKKVIAYAHSINKKVYLTMNIDLKDNELYEAAQILNLCGEVLPDGIIIKDPALFLILEKFYKDKLDIHLSTQNAIASSFGAVFAKEHNVKRAILARELTLDEIKKCTAVSGIEIEIFTEGSMCFSVSGRCFMSSRVGGRSGNRGVCTAPCRVLWESGGKKENYFSMKDMSLLRDIVKLKSLNISALKIEGRLKNPVWIGKITSLYRRILDEKEKSDETLKNYEELKKFSAREISAGHLFGHKELVSKNENWEKYRKTESVDHLENIFPKEKNEAAVSLKNNALSVVIKLFDKENEINFALPVKAKKAKEISAERIRLYFRDGKICGRKFDFIFNNEYFAQASFFKKCSEGIEKKVRELINEEELLPALDPEKESFIKSANQNIRRGVILGSLPDKVIISSLQLSLFLENKYPVKTVVVDLITSFDEKDLQKISEKYELFLSVPEVLFEEDAEKRMESIQRLNKAGFKNFTANSLCGIDILKNISGAKNCGTGLTVMNHLAGDFYYNLGFSSVYASIESDLSMYKALSSFTKGKIEALVFGKIPLFISRVESPYFSDKKVFQDKYLEMECRKYNKLNYFLEKKPFSLINEKVKKENVSFDSLSADLRFFDNPKEMLENIFCDKMPEEDISTFNLYEKLV